MERLDKLLAATGQWSRKEAKALVKAGRVQVGGARPKGPEDKVAEGTPVTVDGRPIATEQGVYVMLHKPAGVVSSTQDPRERTVLDLLPQHLRRRALFPVGRLDKDTEGLLLLTNDGALAHRLTSPRYHVEKCYLATVDGTVDAGDVAAFAAGLTLGDGTSVCRGPGAPGAGALPGCSPGGEISPGETDAGGLRKAGDRFGADFHGPAEAGWHTAPGRLPGIDGRRGTAAPEGRGIGHNRTKSDAKSLSNLLIMPVKIVIILHIKRSMTWQMIPQ